MPEKAMVDPLELNGDVIGDHESDRPTIISIKISPAYEIMSRTEEGLDSNCDNGSSTSSSENEETTNGDSEDSNNHENSDFISSFQKMSMEPGTSEDNVEIKVPETRNSEPYNTESSDGSSSCESSSDEDESDDDDDLTEESRAAARRLVLAKFDNCDKNYNFNDKNEKKSLKNKDHKKTSSSDYNSDDSRNDESDTTSDNDSDDSEDYTERGIFPKSYDHGGKPYDRKGSRNEDSARDRRLPENFHFMLPETNFQESERLDSISAEIELENLLQAENALQWNGIDQNIPSISTNDGSPTPSPQMGYSGSTPPTLASDLSGHSSDINQYSPESYLGDWSWSIEEPESMVSDIQNMSINGWVPNISEPQYFTQSHNDLPKSQENVSGTYSTLGVYDICRNPAMMMLEPQELPHIERSTIIYPIFDGHMETQVEESLSQTNDSSFQDISQIEIDLGISETIPSQPTTKEPPTDVTPFTTRSNTSVGVVTVHYTNESVQTVPILEQNDIQAVNVSHSYSGSEFMNSTSNAKPVLIVPPQTHLTIVNPPLIPTPVQEKNREPSPRRRKPRTIVPWSILHHPTTPPFERLKQNVTPDQIHKSMVKLLSHSVEDFAEQNENGNTYLMQIVQNPTRLSSGLARIGPILSKMVMLPKSLILTNHDGHDALYLAAINCSQFDFVTGALAETIVKSRECNEIWKRTYNDKKDTLIHAIAAKGDTHEAILKELLALHKSQNNALFDLSAQNIEGKTPLHVAIEATNRMGAGIKTANIIRLLVQHGANPCITENRNGETPLHTAMSSTGCLGIVQALLCNSAGHKATNIANYAGNTPVHLAASLLNTVSPGTQRDVCYLLITAGGKANIPNRQNKVPVSLVAPDRREAIAKIFHKKS